MRKRIMVVAGIVLLAGLAGGAAWHFLGSGSSDEESVYVTTVSTLMGNVSGTLNRYAGLVEPESSVTVKADSSRKIASVSVSVGDTVQEGDLLFTYDASDAQSQLASAELQLQRYQNEAVSLQTQIDTLTKEKAQASSDEQLSYTIEIQTAEMDLKKNEYNQQSTEQKIEELKSASENLEVTSTASGVVKSINESLVGSSDIDSDSDSDSGSDGSGTAFITIVQTDNYRVKATINETNLSAIAEGDAVIVRSRVDETVTWNGVIDEINTQETESRNTDSIYSSSSSDEQTTSSSYAFYVSLDSAADLILGQHVYVEPDNGQTEDRTGIWLDEFYIVDVDTSPYVWASNSRDRLEKRSVTLGEYDQELGKYEITDGLTEDDCIAFPDDSCEEGMATSINDSLQYTGGNADSGSDSDWESDSDSGWESDSDSGWDSDSDIEWESDSDSSWAISILEPLFPDLRSSGEVNV